MPVSQRVLGEYKGGFGLVSFLTLRVKSYPLLPQHTYQLLDSVSPAGIGLEPEKVALSLSGQKLGVKFSPKNRFCFNFKFRLL